MSIRLTNNPETGATVTKIQYIDRVVMAEAPAPVIQYIPVPSEPQIITNTIEKLVAVPSESIDLKPLQDKTDQLELKLKALFTQTSQITNNIVDTNNTIMSELEMQRRALVGLKQQRDIDRSRRLMLIKRMKKEHKEHKASIWKLRIAVCCSLLIGFLHIIRL